MSISFDITGKVDPALLAGVERLHGGMTDVGTATEAASKKIAAADTNTQQGVTRTNALLTNMRDVGNHGFQALTEKAAGFAQSIGGVGGDVANVAVKMISGFGHVGMAITAAIGVAEMVHRAWVANAAELARQAAVTASVTEATAHLGGAYASVAEAARTATTAEGARLAVAQQIVEITGEQVSLLGQGFDDAQTRVLTLSFRQLSDATRIAGSSLNEMTPAMVRQALLTGNAAEQNRVLGASFVRSADAATAAAQAVQLTATLRADASRLRLFEAHATEDAARRALVWENSLSTANESSFGTIRRLAPAQDALGRARVALTAATAAATTSERDLANATYATGVADDVASAAGKALAQGRMDTAASAAADAAKTARTAARAAAASSAPSALDTRASVEALRLAQAANDNAGVSRSVSEQQADALLVLAFATNEVRIAEAALRTGSITVAERQALTTALTAQTTAQAALTAVGEADAAARASRVADEDSARHATDVADIAAARVFAAQAESVMDAERLAGDKVKRDDDIADRESYTGRVRELQAAQVNGTQMAAEFTTSAFDAMGKAIGAHVQALVNGKETIGQALQGMLSDTLISVGKEAIIKGGMEIAHGIAAVAGIYTAAKAPMHFAAGAAYLAVGAAAGIAGAAVAPSAAAPAGAAGGASGILSDRAAQGAEGGGASVVNNYYAPVIGGRTATEGESGMQVNRLTNAERRRTDRAA